MDNHQMSSSLKLIAVITAFGLPLAGVGYLSALSWINTEGTQWIALIMSYAIMFAGFLIGVFTAMFCILGFNIFSWIKRKAVTS